MNILNSAIANNESARLGGGIMTQLGAAVFVKNTIIAGNSLEILNPDSALLANSRYKAVVSTGAKDQAGNRLDQERKQPNNQAMEWFFTTGTS